MVPLINPKESKKWRKSGKNERKMAKVIVVNKNAHMIYGLCKIRSCKNGGTREPQFIKF